MNKRILLSSISLFSSLALVTGATFAFFSDVGTSFDNVFAAGTLNLQLDDEDELTPAESVTGSIDTTLTPLAPGESVTGSISLHNDGSIDIAEIELAADRSATDTGTSLPSVLNLTSVRTGSDASCTGSTEHLGAITAGVADGLAPLTMQELIDTSGYDALPGITAGATYFVCFTTEMDSAASNSHQGSVAKVDFIFTANQDASQ